VSSTAPRESIAAVELTPTSSTPGPSSCGGGGGSGGQADKTAGILRPRLDTHTSSTGTERSTGDADDAKKRRSTLTTPLDDVISSQQPAQRDHLRVHTGTGAKHTLILIAAQRTLTRLGCLILAQRLAETASPKRPISCRAERKI